MRLLLLVTFLLLVSACASVPRDFRLDQVEQNLVWPVAPEPPRYRFEGFIYGEKNFKVREVKTFQPKKVLSWLVGLTFGEDEQTGFSRPQTGAVDSSTGRMYVTDSGVQGILVFDQRLGSFELWSGLGQYDNFRTPVGIAVGIDSSVYVADADLGRVFKLDQSGRQLAIFGEGVLKRPTGLCVNPRTQRVYVADSSLHQVLVFDESGVLQQRLGRKGEADGDFNAPTHLACSADKIYISDTLNARVQVFSSDGEWKLSFGRRGMYVGDLPRPKGIAVDDSGRIYIVESYYDYLLVYDDLGRPLLPIGGTGSEPGKFDLPSGVWTDDTGRVFVADMLNHRVAVFRYIGQDSIARPPLSSTTQHNAVSGNENHNKAN